MSDWLHANTNAEPGEGARRQKYGLVLERFPLWNDAAAAGSIGYAQVEALSWVMSKRRFRSAQVDGELLLRAANLCAALEAAMPGPCPGDVGALGQKRHDAERLCWSSFTDPTPFSRTCQI